jgi:hypothetical protein
MCQALCNYAQGGELNCADLDSELTRMADCQCIVSVEQPSVDSTKVALTASDHITTCPEITLTSTATTVTRRSRHGIRDEAGEPITCEQLLEPFLTYYGNALAPRLGSRDTH